MSQIVTFNNKLKLSEAAAILNVCPRTLKNWHKDGMVRLSKTPTGRYYVDRKELERVIFEVKK